MLDKMLEFWYNINSYQPTEVNDDRKEMMSRDNEVLRAYRTTPTLGCR